MLADAFWMYSRGLLGSRFLLEAFSGSSAFSPSSCDNIHHSLTPLPLPSVTPLSNDIVSCFIIKQSLEGRKVGSSPIICDFCWLICIHFSDKSSFFLRRYYYMCLDNTVPQQQTPLTPHHCPELHSCTRRRHM